MKCFADTSLKRSEFYLSNIKLINGIVTTEHKVDKNTAWDARLVFALYSFAIIAVLVAIGIEAIITGIDKSKLSFILNFSIR